MEEHRSEIVEQFTAQAAAFAQADAIRDEAALELLVGFAGTGAKDRVLDVACGPGLVTCAFARVAGAAIGIDVTPAMIDQARAHAVQLGVTNVDWRLEEIPPLPWSERSFEVVVSRYAFHHFEDPLAVLREMARVCTPGGRVVVCDIAPAPDRVEAFNAMDRLRDPSHVRAFSLAELCDLYARADLATPRLATYKLEGDLDALLARSFPVPGGAEEVRRRFRASIDDDHLGVEARADGARITYRYPIAVLAAERG
jgi:ubiquinone/menaquinone biosynthesis C-methylase UbiE